MNYTELSDAEFAFYSLDLPQWFEIHGFIPASTYLICWGSYKQSEIS